MTTGKTHVVAETIVILMACALRASAAQPVGEGGSLKTFSVAGKEATVLNGYKEAELISHDGRGCLTHMWFGGEWSGYEKTQIRIYVDGDKTPSIDMQLGLGDGIGFGDPGAPWGTARMGKTGHPSGIYNTFRVPFGKSIRATAERDKNSPDGAPFWWIIRGTENLSVTLGGVRLPETARLKLYKRENFTAKPLEEFDLCNAKKPGALFLVTMAAGSKGNLNFLEACMRAYFDGAVQPQLLSSGLEDYFLGTYYFNRGKYQTPVAGLTHLVNNDFSAYRFHDDDPIFFQKGLRLTCRCGEEHDGHAFGDPQETTYSTYTWVYEWDSN
jgi:hypothetical protein